MRALLLGFVLMSGCGYKHLIKRLEPQEAGHYEALRVFMEEDQRKEYLRLKTQDERDGYLKSKGLWDKFYNVDEDRRKQILSREVKVGWNKEELLMAWGLPIKKQIEPQSRRARSERWIYKFELHTNKKDGSKYVLLWEENSKTEYKSDRVFIREVVIEDHGRPELTDDFIAEIVDN